MRTSRCFGLHVRRWDRSTRKGGSEDAEVYSIQLNFRDLLLIQGRASARVREFTYCPV